MVVEADANDLARLAQGRQETYGLQINGVLRGHVVNGGSKRMAAGLDHLVKRPDVSGRVFGGAVPTVPPGLAHRPALFSVLYKTQQLHVFSFFYGCSDVLYHGESINTYKIYYWLIRTN